MRGLLHCREQKFSTAVAKEGGKNPVWNEEFVFEITTEKEISIDVRTTKQEYPIERSKKRVSY
jgi:Ca2+-dependent lipid-binding protein